MNNLRVVGLYISPIKSTAVQAVREIQLDEIGIVNDRRWMLVNGNGSFWSQRDLPRMSLIEVRVERKQQYQFLVANAPEMETLEIPILTNPKSIRVGLRKSKGLAYDDDPDGYAYEWFSEFLDDECYLVRLPPKEWSSARNFKQPVESAYDPTARAQAGFTDGYPLTILSTGSFFELKKSLPGWVSPRIDIENFRTNIIVSDPAFVEDTWAKIRIGSTVIHGVKPCARCDITQVDRKTGEKIEKEPLATLAMMGRVRVIDKRQVVIFSQNCIHETTGAIKVGDPIEVLEAKSSL